jgi:folate-dependent phosphoribosylglycinamide formyltransferase PurN
MRLGPTPDGRALRVVVLSGGPTLDPAVGELVDRLSSSDEVELTGVYCETERGEFGGVWADLWRRRGVLAFPLLAQRALAGAGRVLRDPRGWGARRRRLAALAARVHAVEDLHAPEVLGDLERLAPDLALVYGGPILRPRLFDLPRWGTLGIHHGKVPEYRGKKTMFWAIYNGESEAGVTIQHVGSGLDRGGVVAAGAVRVGRRLPGRIWRELEALGLELYVDAVLRVKREGVEPAAQSGKRRKLYRDPRPGQIAAFWWRYLRRLVSTAGGPP